MPDDMQWLRQLRKDKEVWTGLLGWLNKLDRETVQKYDAAKEFPDWLLAKGARSFYLEVKSRLTREDL